MAAICSKREYCEYDIRVKLRTRDIEEELINEIIANLKRLSFIDNERFAISYAKDKFRFNGWGTIKIAAMLSAKQIDEATIKIALSEIDTSEYKDQCLALLKNKARSIKAKGITELRNKLLRYAHGRGFDYETSLQALSEITLQAKL